MATPQLTNTKPLPSLNDTIARSKAMLAQTKAEGDTPFAGSSYEKTLKTPTPAPTPTGKFTPPEPAADTTRETFFTSMTDAVGTARSSLEKRYQAELDTITKDKERTQKEIDRYTDMQETLIDRDIEPLLKPFREELENKERKRLYIDQNFEANQKLTNELETLLNEGNALIRAKKEQPIPLSLQNKQLDKTLADISARTGVIEAVMSARSGQIAEAYRLIDRSVAAMTADREDQLSYYKAIFDFYQGEKDTKGDKLLSLDRKQEEFVSHQIGLLENDLALAQTNAENLKAAMMDPDTALLYADAGVTLADTPEQISTKVAEATYAREVRELSNDMALNGYTYAPDGAIPPGASAVTVTDSRGKVKTYYAYEESSGSGGEKDLTAAQQTTRDSLNAVMASLSGYRALYDQLVGPSGALPTGVAAGRLSGAYNALIFQIAQAAGTGALQAADREVVEAMIPNPTTGSGIIGTFLKGGKQGALGSIDEANKVFQNKLDTIGGGEISASDDGDRDADNLPSEEDAIFDNVIGTQSRGNYFGRLWNAIIGN